MAALWLAPIVGLLLPNFLHLQYGFYTLLRLVVYFCAGVIAYRSWKSGQGWAVAFVIIALLFNPVFPVLLSRATWMPIDLGVAALFGVHWLAAGRKEEAA